MFVFVAGATALGILTLAASLTRFPLLFPQLGPSAFILFYTPMSVAASPRNLVLSHSLAVVGGFLSLWFVGSICPEADLSDPSVLDGYRVAAIALSMGLIGAAMITLKSVHPPAAASALITAMGYLSTPDKILGILGAVILLGLEAILFNRVIGGLPYPLWRADPKVARNYGQLAGIPETATTFWQQLAAKTFQRR
jgi:CBS-domain-containing membrane protein